MTRSHMFVCRSISWHMLARACQALEGCLRKHATGNRPSSAMVRSRANTDTALPELQATAMPQKLTRIPLDVVTLVCRVRPVRKGCSAL